MLVPILLLGLQLLGFIKKQTLWVLKKCKTWWKVYPGMGHSHVFPFRVEFFAGLCQETTNTDTRWAFGSYLAWHQELQEDGCGEPVQWMCFCWAERPENSVWWQFLTWQRKEVLLHGVIPLGFLLQIAQENWAKKPFWQRGNETEKLSTLNKRIVSLLRCRFELLLFVCFSESELHWFYKSKSLSQLVSPHPTFEGLGCRQRSECVWEQVILAARKRKWYLKNPFN